jgi:hypothetical protein
MRTSGWRSSLLLWSVSLGVRIIRALRRRRRMCPRRLHLDQPRTHEAGRWRLFAARTAECRVQAKAAGRRVTGAAVVLLSSRMERSSFALTGGACGNAATNACSVHAGSGRSPRAAGDAPRPRRAAGIPRRDEERLGGPPLVAARVDDDPALRDGRELRSVVLELRSRHGRGSRTRMPRPGGDVDLEIALDENP